VYQPVRGNFNQGKRVKKLLKIRDVLAHVPVSRSQLYAMVAAGRFPKPIHLGGSGSFWVLDEVEAWLDAQIETERAA
jgi:prophage regulatory protein